MTTDQEIGARVRQLREHAKVSQAALGKAINVSFQQIQKYERGKNRITLSAAMGMAEALGVHPAAFFPPRAGAAGDYMAGMADGKAEGVSEGISRALARLRPVILDLEKTAYQIAPDSPGGEVVALKR